MKVAVVYNRVSQRVINVFGTPNLEKYGLKNIKRITDALKAGGHQVAAFEGDKDLIDKLEEFMPRVIKGERPGLAFNISYGIQGQARYTHVPGMLEMIGIPYVGSGPLAHSLALDKVVAKMIFVQNDLPTPEFVVLQSRESELPDMQFPLIVKPKNEAVSFGIQRVENQDELRKAADAIFEKFDQPVLVEQFVTGREINVGLLGNSPVEALPPVELSFGDGPQIYTYEDKAGKSGREITLRCPAPVGEEIAQRAQELAKRAFHCLGCFDCARVDFRIDEAGKVYILEVNSLPSLGQRGSYVRAAQEIGLDFAGLCNRLVEVASARYFGTPQPPSVAATEKDPRKRTFEFLTSRRDRIEKRLRSWTRISSRTTDPIGLRLAAKELEERLTELGMTPVDELTDRRATWTYRTKAGLDGGTLLLVQLDVPLRRDETVQVYRRDPEMLFGEGIAVSRAPLTMLEYALRALRTQRLLAKTPLAVLAYGDEGQDCTISGDAIRTASARASRVLVLRAGNPPDRVVLQRRGRRNYLLAVEGRARQLGQLSKKPDVFPWFCQKAVQLVELSSRREKLAIGLDDVTTRSFPELQPHRVEATLTISYLEPATCDRAEQQVRATLGRGEHRWQLELLSHRPPMRRHESSGQLYERLKASAAEWDIPLDEESSVWPSAAGFVGDHTPVLCGVGPVGEHLFTPQERVSRISLVQRTLLLAEFLQNTR